LAVLERVIRIDNGPPFASVTVGGLSRLAVWWIQLGIRLERILPGHPEQNGRHERMHRTLKAETARPVRRASPLSNVRSTRSTTNTTTSAPTKRSVRSLRQRSTSPRSEATHVTSWIPHTRATSPAAGLLQRRHQRRANAVVPEWLPGQPTHRSRSLGGWLLACLLRSRHARTVRHARHHQTQLPKRRTSHPDAERCA
jgi:hypothetical protein